jgi:hypothetical protein
VRFSQQGNQIGTNFARTSRSLERTALLAEAAVRQNRGKIGETLDNLSGAMASLQDVLGEVKSALADETARTNLRETLAQMHQAMANLREASANLAKATADVRNLTSDPKLNEDLRQTVASTRSTMEQADELVGRLNHLVGGKSSGASGARQQAVRSDFRADVMHRTSLERTSLDLDATLPRKGGFYRLGIHDFGEGSGLNLQLGNLFGSGRSSVRYGLYASRPGLGLDLGRPERPWLETNLYGFEETKLDLRGAYGFRRDLDLILGVEELFRQNSPVIGLRWRPLRH